MQAATGNELDLGAIDHATLRERVAVDVARGIHLAADQRLEAHSGFEMVAAASKRQERAPVFDPSRSPSWSRWHDTPESAIVRVSAVSRRVFPAAGGAIMP